MISAWLLSRMRRLTDQNKYMRSILWAYANGKTTGREEAEQAIKIVEGWEDSNDITKRSKT